MDEFLAQQKASSLQVAVGLLSADALRLPFADGAFDAVVTAFALRNVTDIPAAFSEMARVTLVGTMMDTDTPTVPLDASLAEALSLFEQTGAWALPVVEGRRFSGLLSKSSLFDHYRRELSVQAPR